MEIHYSMKPRYLRALFLVLLIALVVASPGYSQTRNGVEKGFVRIKVTEELAAQLSAAKISENNQVLVTGIQALDKVNSKVKAKAIRRVFREAGKFEAKHRRYGLHLWYEIQIDKATDVMTALRDYKGISQVIVSEPIYTKAIIGSDNPNYGPVVFNKNSLPANNWLEVGANDPLLPAQWHYNNTGQTGGTVGADADVTHAWQISTGSSEVIVAVTDGGVQVNHPDLAANMWVNEDEIPGNNIDDDGNGYVDDVNGYGFGDDTGEIAPDAHGTHVAGTIAAVTNNGIGVAGVAGGSGSGNGARIMSCAAFGATANGGFADTYIYAADNGALISQNSWGYTIPGVFEQAVLDGIDYFIAEAGTDEFGNQVGLMKGGIVFFAAGNSDSNEQHYPGFYESTFAVAGTTHEDKKAWYSNFGPWVEIAAPGGETNSVAQEGVLSTLSNSQYGFFQGTSMACPHVSGLAVLIISRFGKPGFTPNLVKDRIIQTSDNIDAADPAFAGLLGAGRINAFSALQEDDGQGPEVITDLAIVDFTTTTVTLAWTSPVDQGSGSASTYDIRYSTSPIDGTNFGSATQVSGEPHPSLPGQTDQYTVTGLTEGTRYYFAITAWDFFGNGSTPSNVVSIETPFPSVLRFSPDSLSVNLLTGQEIVEQITVHNDGDGPLEILIDSAIAHAQPGWNVFIVPANSSLLLDITLDAHGLLGGVYNVSLTGTSNDPLQPTFSYPITLNVSNNGAPIAEILNDTVDFGAVFEGVVHTKPFSITNHGSDTLEITSVSSTNPDFSVATPVKIAPFEVVAVPVDFDATTLGSHSAQLTVHTNDPANPELTVTALAEVTPAPVISVTPDSLYQELNTDHTATQTLTVSNDGGSNLDFTVETSAVALSAVTTKTIDIPATAVAVSAAQKSRPLNAKSGVQKVAVRSVGQLAAVQKVLILTPDNNVTDIEALLDSFDDIEADVFPKASLPSITADAFDGYDVVFTTNNTQWLGSGAVDPVLIGDLLADYVDGGGKVIVNQFAYSYDAWKMDGRFITENYGPFTPSTTDAIESVSIGTILSPGHQLLEGVSSINYSGFVQNVGLTPGSTGVAEWSNGELFLAANSNVVALNMLPSLGDGGSFQWDGDLATVYQNAVHYLSGATFVSVSPLEGSLAPGTSLDLTVTFDATGMDNGYHHALINILSNDPASPTVSVPATLRVLGPAYSVTPDSIYAEVEQGGTTTETLVLSNNGQVDINYDVTVQTHGVSAVVARKVPSAIQSKVGRRAPVSTRKDAPSGRVKVDLDGTLAISTGNTAARQRTSETLLAVDQYATDFESFTPGDISGQEDWFGQFGNWTIEAINPSSGAQHFRGLSDGLGLSRAFSPEVTIGSEPKSTLSLKANISGSGVTWQFIPQSPSAGFVNTRIQISPDRSVQVLESDGAGGGAFVETGATAPSGYFDLTLECDRATSEFRLLFNGTEVFSGLGFAGDIEQLVILSGMEVAGPTLDIDDLRIIDGTAEFEDPYITVAPSSGTLSPGESVELLVTFNATELEFGTYSADVKIGINGTDELVVPTTLRVFGDPSIQVSPTVIQAQVPYKGDTTHIIAVQNTGGNPLTYGIQVIGAATDVAKLPPSPVSKFANWKQDRRITEKLAKDLKASKTAVVKDAIEIRTGLPLFTENFDGGAFPPGGWEIVDNAGSGVVWDFADAWGEGNYSGTGEAATVSSDAAGAFEFDTELITPWINAGGYKNIALQYNVNYANYANLDFLNVDIQVAGSSSWTTVLSWNEDHGAFRGTPGEFVSLVLDDYLAGATSFRVRWHYYDPNSGDWDWYAQIDDISILGDARAWLSVSPASGTVPVRGTAAVNALFDAEDIEPGFYVAGVIVNSNAVNTPVVGVVASLDVLRPAAINVEPDDLKQKLFVGEIATQTLSIENSGVSPLHFSFEGVATAGAPDVAKERIPTVPRTTRNTDNKKVDERLAIAGPPTKLAGTDLYATSFEEFATGDINGQLGWAGQFGNWSVETANPYMGSQHLRSVSDGLGQTLAFSPTVAVGTEEVNSTTVRLNVLNLGVTWQVIPQSPTAGFVNTRFEISPDGSMRTLIDTLGGIYATVPGTWPSGYAELRLDFVRATKQFTVFINGTPVFSGKGFAGDIEQVVLYSLMEEVGPTLDIDNLAIIDGTPSAPWLLVSPLSGTVPSGTALPVTVTFNAQDLEGGNYYDTLNIGSNDPATPWTYVPVALTVISNIPPVLADIEPRTVLEKQIASVTFTATDVDDSLVSVQLLDYPAFITPAGSGNGFATYNIKPMVGHEGTYDLAVLATDARGATDVDTFKLAVQKFAVNSFAVVNITTGEVIAEFTDAITLNRALPGFANLNIQAIVTPSTVGSVKFKINGSQQNIDNTNPYWLKGGWLAGAGVGTYTLFGEPFTENFGHGQRGIAKTATITIVNAANVVNDFSLVNVSTGAMLKTSGDSIVVSTTDPDFLNLNIRANTTPGVVGSVKFKINGSQRNIDNAIPYLLQGSVLRNLTPGTYTLLGEPYSEAFGHGTKGLGKTIVLVVNGASATSARAAAPDESQNSKTIVSVFPVPVRDILTVDLKGRKAEGQVDVVIFNPLGQVIHRTRIEAENLQGYQISTQALGMRNGVYYLRLQSTTNLRETTKFTKE